MPKTSKISVHRIALSGKIGSGKSAIANRIREILGEQVRIASFAAPLKEVAYEYLSLIHI